jgi:DNA (cytosine-5)-methyltransferase 1
MYNKPVSISLFSGAFGLDLGIEQAGFNCLVAIENNKDCVATIKANRPDLLVIQANIEEMTGAEILAGVNSHLGTSLRAGDIDLVAGGPPCQPFSTAGKRLSTADPRGELFLHFLRIIKEIQPRFFLMENVKGILSSFCEVGGDRTPLLDRIIQAIAEIGYRSRYSLLQAADYGVPQCRERLFFLGEREPSLFCFPSPIHEKGKSWITVGEAFAALGDVSHEYSPYSAQALKYFDLLCSGQDWRNLPLNLQGLALGKAYFSGGGRTGYYRRLNLDKPSPTITCSPKQKSTGMCHPTETRPISVQESAVLQSFPLDWIFKGSTSSKYRQIGNAVPVGVARAIAQQLIPLLVQPQLQ